MLFKRRDKEPLSKKIGNLLWPRMGFRRMFDYYKHRTIRIPDSEYSIAMGMGFGCLVSWTPTFGTHLLQCLLYCWIFRANFVAAFIGSGLGNFWTTPFMMYISYQVGKFILDVLGYDHILTNYTGEFGEEELTFSWELFKEHGWRPFLPLFVPTLIGGYVVGIATFPLFYYPTYYMVRGARKARRRLLERKVHKEAQVITGEAE
jgi:uncharacterized protein (DUF2062 family)